MTYNWSENFDINVSEYIYFINKQKYFSKEKYKGIFLIKKKGSNKFKKLKEKNHICIKGKYSFSFRHFDIIIYTNYFVVIDFIISILQI